MYRSPRCLGAVLLPVALLLLSRGPWLLPLGLRLWAFANVGVAAILLAILLVDDYLLWRLGVGVVLGSI